METKNVSQNENTETVITACGMCQLGCGVKVTVKNGEIENVVGIESHPLNRGGICPRPTRAREFIYHPDRIKYPMRKRNGGWERISWDEALETIVDKLKLTKEKYGASSLAICFGMVVLTQGTGTISFIRRFCDAFGTPSVFSVDAMCWRARLVGTLLTFGKYPMPDVEESKCIIVLGNNPHNSAWPVMAQISRAQKKGAKLIVIDPRTTQTAKKADMHIKMRPGADGALLLAMLHIIVSEKRYDEDFVSKWTHGFDKLEAHVKQYTPEWAEKVTWIPATTIRELARVYSSEKPAVIISPNNTIEESGNATQNHRAISILQAITGNFGVPGGDVTFSGSPRSPIRLEAMLKEKPLGMDRYPLFHGFWGRLLGEGEGQTMLVPDAILKGDPYPIKTVIVSGSNPLMTWPNSQKVRQAFKNLDFLVVMDLFMSDTAKLADIVLPAASGFERTEIYDFYSVLTGIPYVMLKRKIVDIGECWSDMKFYLELAKKMGYQDHFPWKDTDEVFDYMFKPTGLTIKKLMEEWPEGMPFGKKLFKVHETKGRFPTPSGKVEIYSNTLEELGHDPLPTFTEPPESPFSTPQLYGEFPIILTTGARLRPVLHSMYRNVSKLQNLTKGPIAEIHPETAHKYGITDGAMVQVETKRGKIEIKADVTEDILPGVVSITHGWPQSNVNLLTDNEPVDPVVGYPSIRALLCRISPLS
ncbi:MAG: molybdopterin-dependent oxidoreductase [Desulfobacterales bacterium]|jgi:anaerobic selenocysteine-containing dehydrogenase|nr:molybdopterin-dependent oxidoreductase [Desulfobacterales bacterium]